MMKLLWILLLCCTAAAQTTVVGGSGTGPAATACTDLTDAKSGCSTQVGTAATQAATDFAASNAAITVNGESCPLGSTCTVADSTKVPTSRTINGQALSGNISLTPTDIGFRSSGPLTGDGSSTNPISCPSCALQGASPGYAPGGLISGGGVVWTSGLTFSVSAATYSILGVQYSSPLTSLTLDAAHATLDRIDVFAVNDAGEAVIIKGNASATPIQPDVDPSSQIALTFVYVASTATTPSNVASTLLYSENVGATAEWNATNSGAGFNLASTNNPQAGTKDIEATAVDTNNYVQLQKGTGTVDLSTQNLLAFYIRSKASFPSKRTVSIYFANAGTRVGNIVTFTQGSFGFDSAATSAYQQIVIPLSLFNTAALAVNQLVFKIAGTGTTLGFYLDNIQLQGGATQQISGSTVNWRGTWTSSAAYNQNDMVSYLGASWMAAAGNVNSAPSTTNANWQVNGAKGWPHLISFIFNGAGQALTTGLVAYTRVPFTCTIVDWSIGSTTAETVTLKTWKIAAGGTALPTVTNVISTNGVSLSSGTAVRSTTITDFTDTAVAANQWMAATLIAVTASQMVTFQIGCQE